MTDIGTINPNTADDVQFTTAPHDANGLQTGPSLTWSVTPAVGTLQVAPNTLSALFITPDGEFSGTVTVTTAEGVSDTATVSRTAGVTTVIGLAGELVPKA